MHRLMKIICGEVCFLKQTKGKYINILIVKNGLGVAKK